MTDDSTTGTSWMTERMVTDRCMRMWSQAQWKRLHDFCRKEPRGVRWVLARIALVHALSRDDPRVAAAAEALAEGADPRVLTDGSGAVVHVSDDDVEVVEQPAPTAPPPAMAVPAQVPAPSAAGNTVELPGAFVDARDKGDFVTAADELLAWLRTLPAGAQPRMLAVEAREVLAEVARTGDIRTVVDITTLLPARLTAGALHDLGEKLRIGAVVHGAVLHFAQQLTAGSRVDRKKAEEQLVESVRRAVEQHGVK